MFVRPSFVAFVPRPSLTLYPSASVQAWFMLGQSHAENDQDRLAISCLERAVEMDPYSLDALLVRL